LEGAVDWSLAVGNGCGPEAQREIARSLRGILGERLFVPPPDGPSELTFEAVAGRVLVRDKPSRCVPELLALVSIANVRIAGTQKGGSSRVPEDGWRKARLAAAAAVSICLYARPREGAISGQSRGLSADLG